MFKVKTFFDDGTWWLINTSYVVVGYLFPFLAVTLWGMSWFVNLHHIALWVFSTSLIAGGLLLSNCCLAKEVSLVGKVMNGVLLCVIGGLYMV
ncbi:hypothetical protein [Secundilactobacillus kimchicus]|uniref:hypothetical protein n=1 Tax=Secundilactobacillus kimchicus TaxID=528209 RepID=UPI0024A86AE4|nr:hypothetical protein [Secundilactobacillus kimchicus]